MKDVKKLRKASGSRLLGTDPEMSEWGNPAVVIDCYRASGANGAN